MALGDTEWIQHADAQIENATEDLTRGYDTEPAQAVYLALISTVVTEHEGVFTELPERVLLSKVTKALEPEEQRLNSWQVGILLRKIGIDVHGAGGNQYVYTGGEDNLRKIGLELGVKDDWVDGGMKP